MVKVESEPSTHIICHLAHQAGSKFNENLLHIYDIVRINGFVQTAFCVIQYGRQCYIDEVLQIGVTEKSQTSLPLNLPELSVSVDDTIAYRGNKSAAVSARPCGIAASTRLTEQIPRSGAEESAFDEDVVVLQYMLYVLRITDDDGRWQRWDTDLKCRKASLMVGSDEPIQELVSGLKKP